MKTNINQTTRRLAAIMFTDIVGYTALMQQDENRTAQIRNRHRQVFVQEHQKHHGEILQYFGDGTLSVFQSCLEAVECAIAIQQALQYGEVPVPLRIGLHMGDIVFDGTDIYGDGVNLASRIESMSIEGAILLSDRLNEELKNHPHITTQSMGSFALKNIARPVQVFAVSNKGITLPKRSELKGKRKNPKRSLAVLPFVNMSGDADKEYFSDGMTEEIINALSKIKGLQITSRTSSFYFKNKNVPIPQIGRELNVNVILEGSIRLAGSRMRLTAQLIDVAEDVHFWSESFDRSIDDIFAVQDEISLLIADKLREQIGHFEIEDRLVEAPPISIDLYQRYLKGRYLSLKMNPSDIEEAIHIYESILHVHPDFAPAHLGINQSYAILGAIGLVPFEEAFAKGQAHLNKAIEIDKNLPECQIQLSWKSFLEEWDFPGTYRHLKKSAAIRPTVDYYQSMASTLSAEGKLDAARHHIDIAIQIDPFSAINQHLKGFSFYLEEKYDKAIDHFKKGRELKSDFHISTIYWGTALIIMNHPDQALHFFEQLPEDEPGVYTRLAGTTMAHAALQHLAQAEKGIVRLHAALETDAMGRALNLLIICHTVMGNYEEAIQLIEKGFNSRIPLLIYLFTDPVLKPIRKDHRFQELVKKALPSGTQRHLEKRKYKQNLFSKKELADYQHRLTRLMQKEEPYLNPDLTLRNLAESMGLPPNHLSQLLNEGFDKNFSEFVNAYRLDIFKSKLADPENQHLTLLAIAYDSGFNSKTVFNTYFKKKMGMTPSAYWKEIKAGT